MTFTDDAGNDPDQRLPWPLRGRPTERPRASPPSAGRPRSLTADTSITGDQRSYSYQWIAGGSDIGGATGSTYTLTSSEQGKTIQVTTDDADNEETLTSEATAEVTAAPVPLTASRPDSRFQSARHNGADDRPQVIVAFSLAVASFEKTTPSLSLTGAAVRSVRQHEEDGLDNAWIFFLDPDGSDDIVFSLVTGRPCDSGGICTEDGGMLSGGVQVTLPGPEEEGEPDNPEPDDTNSPATGAPTISGTPQVGETLTADTSGIADADGLTIVLQLPVDGRNDGHRSGLPVQRRRPPVSRESRPGAGDLHDDGHPSPDQLHRHRRHPGPLTVRLKVHPRRPTTDRRVHLRHRVQRGVRPGLRDPAGPRLQCNGRVRGDGAENGQAQQHSWRIR